MTPSEAISKLDNQIALHGQTVTIARGASTATVQAFVRGFKPNELVGDLQQGDVRVVFSPTFLTGFPLPIAAGDKLTIAGELKNVEDPEHVRMHDQIVRINVVARG